MYNLTLNTGTPPGLVQSEMTSGSAVQMDKSYIYVSPMEITHWYEHKSGGINEGVYMY